MPARIIVDLGEGQIALFGGKPEPGTPDAAVNNYTRADAGDLAGAFAAIAKVAAGVEAAIDALPRKPGAIEIEFGATLSQECDLWIVPPNASAEFRVRLSWGKEG